MRYKSIILLIIVMILSYVLPLITNNWQFVIIAGIINGLFFIQKFRSFIISFIGTLLSWTISILFVISSTQNQKLLALISQIAGIPSMILLLIFILSPAIVAGLSSLAVTLIRNLIIKKSESSE